VLNDIEALIGASHNGKVLPEDNFSNEGVEMGRDVLRGDGLGGTHTMHVGMARAVIRSSE
jgi:hypothetical protein